MLPSGPWFLPAWMVVGAVLDKAASYVIGFGILWVSRQINAQTAFVPQVISSLTVVWLVHAAIMPHLAMKRMTGRQALKLFGLGIAFVVLGTGVAWLGGIFVGVISFAVLEAMPPSATPASRFDAGFGLTGLYIVIALSFAFAGALVGTVLYPFLRAALPDRSRVGLWMNAAGGAFAAATPTLLIPLVIGGGLSPVAVSAAVFMSPVVALLPHLWFVGRAVRRSLP